MQGGTFKRAAPPIVWATHVLIVATCLALKPSGWRDVFLIFGWMASAAGAIWLSRGHRMRAVQAILVSAFLVSKTIMFILLSIACARGDCV